MMNIETVGATIAERCVWARHRLGLSQKELADLAGVSYGLVGNLETGRGRTVRRVTALARALRVDPDWLAEGIGASPAAHPGDWLAQLQASEAECALLRDWLLAWRAADQPTRSLIESSFAVAAGEQAATRPRRRSA